MKQTPPFQLDMNIIMQEQNNVHAKRAEEKFASAVQPIYGATAGGEPDHIGSAVLMDIHGTKILITAAHIIDESTQRNKTNLYVGGSEKLELIDAEFSITIGRMNRKLDKYDIAFCQLPPPLVEKLNARYIGLADVAHYKPYEKGRLYTALGFPNSMNKMGLKERIAKKAPSRMLRYAQLYSFDEEVAHNLPNGGDDHIFIPYSKQSRNEEGLVVSSTSPIGMSGGAVIDCGNVSSLEAAAGATQPFQKLAGISIEFHKQRVMISTRMCVIIPELKKAFPQK